MKHNIKKLLALLILSSFIVVGCSDDDNPTIPQTKSANVNVVHIT